MLLTLKERSPEIYTQRRDRFLADLPQGCAVFGMGSALGAGSKSHGALRFLSGWDGQEASSLLMLLAGEACLLISSPFMLPIAKEVVPELNPEFLPQENWSDAFATFFETQNPAWIGANELPASVYEKLRGQIRGGMDATPCLDRLRLQKDNGAISLHRDGGAICDHLFGLLPGLVEIGKPVSRIQTELEYEAKCKGADYCNTWLTIRPIADRPRYWPLENRDYVKENSQIMLGVALTVDGHWAHAIRMSYLGQPDPRHEAFHKIVESALSAGIDRLKVGEIISAPMEAMEAHLRKMDFEGMYGPSCGFRHGHGLGLSYEDPVLTDYFPQEFGAQYASDVRQGPEVMQAGMLFELHPNLFFEGVGGAALGDMVLTTDQGPQTLTNFPRGLIKIGS